MDFFFFFGPKSHLLIGLLKAWWKATDKILSMKYMQFLEAVSLKKKSSEMHCELVENLTEQ